MDLIEDWIEESKTEVPGLQTYGDLLLDKGISAMQFSRPKEDIIQDFVHELNIPRLTAAEIVTSGIQYFEAKKVQKQRPLAVFWDMENIRIPQGLSGLEMIKILKQKLAPCGVVERINAYFAFDHLHMESIDRGQMDLSGCTIIDTPHNGRKEVADKRIIVDCMMYAFEKRETPAAVAFITGDTDFAYVLSKLRGGFPNMTTILITNGRMKPVLDTQADVLYRWEADILGFVLPQHQLTPASDQGVNATAEDIAKRSKTPPKGGRVSPPSAVSRGGQQHNRRPNSRTPSPETKNYNAKWRQKNESIQSYINSTISTVTFPPSPQVVDINMTNAVKTALSSGKTTAATTIQQQPVIARKMNSVGTEGGYGSLFQPFPVYEENDDVEDDAEDDNATKKILPSTTTTMVVRQGSGVQLGSREIESPLSFFDPLTYGEKLTDDLLLLLTIMQDLARRGIQRPTVTQVGHILGSRNASFMRKESRTMLIEQALDADTGFLIKGGEGRKSWVELNNSSQFVSSAFSSPVPVGGEGGGGMFPSMGSSPVPPSVSSTTAAHSISSSSANPDQSKSNATTTTKAAQEEDVKQKRKVVASPTQPILIPRFSEPTLVFRTEKAAGMTRHLHFGLLVKTSNIPSVAIWSQITQGRYVTKLKSPANYFLVLASKKDSIDRLVEGNQDQKFLQSGCFSVNLSEVNVEIAKEVKRSVTPNKQQQPRKGTPPPDQK